jgi:hypothetical protein
MSAIGPYRTWALALHMSAFIQMRTYTEIYARISADPPPSGAIILDVEEDRHRHDDHHSNYRLVRGGRVGSSRSTLAPLRGSALDYVEKQRY